MKPQVNLTSGMGHTCAAPEVHSPRWGILCVCGLPVSHRTPALSAWLGASLLGSPEAALAQRVGPIARLLHAASVEPEAAYIHCSAQGTVKPHLGTRPAGMQPTPRTQGKPVKPGRHPTPDT